MKMEVIAAVIALGLGLGLGQWIASRRQKTQVEAAERRTEKRQAEHADQLEQLREELVADQQGAEDELKQNLADLRQERGELNTQEQELKASRVKLDSERERFTAEDRALASKEQQLEASLARMSGHEEELAAALERVANLTQDEALSQLREQLLGEAEQRAAGQVRKIQQRVQETLREETAKVLARAVFRYGSETVAEVTTTPVALPGDESKGRIIGREGRNIQAFEQATGVDVIIDDTPELITLSCFNPVRREVARIALERLIDDGRIHPSRIEEQVQKAQKNLDKALRVRGDDAAAELGLHGINPTLLELLGKLHLHQIMGQNQLHLAVTVARLAELIAQALEQPPKVARRAGLLCMIGRAADHHHEGSAAQISADLARKHGEAKPVVEALEDIAHKDDPKSVAGMMLGAAIQLAESRPGARHEQLGKAVERLVSLEALATEFDGVRSAHAVLAGSEIRVLVDPDQVGEGQLLALAQRLARRIQEDAEPMGEVRVHVVRETRIHETAL
jgi:ribonuclease Y